jgi:hypothetical protein
MSFYIAPVRFYIGHSYMTNKMRATHVQPEIPFTKAKDLLGIFQEDTGYINGFSLVIREVR